MNGKGSRRRPPAISEADLERKWAEVFGRPSVSPERSEVPRSGVADVDGGILEGDDLC